LLFSEPMCHRADAACSIEHTFVYVNPSKVFGRVSPSGYSVES
jgi:hypothetical protein